MLSTAQVMTPVAINLKRSSLFNVSAMDFINVLRPACFLNSRSMFVLTCFKAIFNPTCNAFCEVGNF